MLFSLFAASRERKHSRVVRLTPRPAVHVSVETKSLKWNAIGDVGDRRDALTDVSGLIGTEESTAARWSNRITVGEKLRLRIASRSVTGCGRGNDHVARPW